MPSTSDRVKTAYRNWSEVYDTNKNATRDLNASVLSSMNLPITGKRVLEIGCGTGINTGYLVGQAEHVTAVDFSSEMIGIARGKISATNVEWIIDDITRPWNFEDDSFDMIIATLVLEHIEDITHVYNEASRVLAPEGHLYISELHPYRQLRHSQAKFVDQQSGEEVLVDAFIHPVSEYVNAALNAGFILNELNEHQNEDDDIPRLLTLLMIKQ